MAKSGRGTPSKSRSKQGARREGIVAKVDAACRLVASGRRAARELAAWMGDLAVTEPEFRLLWLLERLEAATAGPDALDQASLADRLAVSPAQMSGLVERLSASGMIEPQPQAADRRRQLWSISLAGKSLIGNVIARLETLAANTSPANSLQDGCAAREVA
jgi:DNA-binding MarR family transcriptional regulator